MSCRAPIQGRRTQDVLERLPRAGLEQMPGTNEIERGISRRGDAVALFMSYVGIPAAQIAGMRQGPFWSGLEAVAPTLAYDHIGILESDAAIPVERAARVRASTLVMHGGASFAFMGETARTLSHAIPRAQLRTLEGQSQQVDPAVLAPALIDFFAQD